MSGMSRAYPDPLCVCSVIIVIFLFPYWVFLGLHVPCLHVCEVRLHHSPAIWRYQHE